MSAGPFITPVEEALRPSTSTEILAYLARLAAGSPRACCQHLGHSVRGQALVALHCGEAARGLPRVLLVGSHHGGSEPAGGEALLLLARDLLYGDLQGLLERFEFMLVPNANPDGRDAGSARNAREVNLNRDYGLLSQPETQAVNALLLAWRPHIVLDAHESAALKRHTLGAEGYLTDFDCQIDIANHPASTAAQQALAVELLEQTLQEVRANGLRAQRYIKEIRSIRKPMTHGGVAIGRFRNKAALYGALSFLLETPMLPKDEVYPSYQNIAARTAQQQVCLRSFLRVLARSPAVLDGVPATATPLCAGMALSLSGHYQVDPHEPVRWLDLQRYPSREPIQLPFANHGWLRPGPAVVVPTAYYITEHTAVFARALSAHGLRYEWVTQAATVPVRSWRCAPTGQRAAAEDRLLALAAGHLQVSTTQPLVRLACLLLEWESPSALRRYPEFQRLAVPGECQVVHRARALAPPAAGTGAAQRAAAPP
ncbi:MAG: hypothetical protein EXR83_03020 [Gammaproteobacteria bacterium]|nr:hypothetical protein [Gammaproteobacteria bacterium]